MNISNLTDYAIPIVVIACLIVGYCIKHISWLDKVSNEYIPLILAVLGAILGCVANTSITLESVVFGALSGLISTGLHQTFTQLLNKFNSESEDK